MSSSPLEGKTVRPGSLGAYSYYRSNRRPEPARRPQPAFIASRRSKLLPKKLIITVLVLAALIGLPMLRSDGPPAKTAGSSASSSSNSKKATPAAPAAAVVAAPAKATNHCAGNTQNKLIVVSISQRHLWACQGEKSVHDTPVITGNTSYEATLTPPGDYKVYGKQTDTRLTGTDVTGSWDRPVDYWMPFLTNEHGTYGFHDANWRPNGEFGKVDPGSSEASHGCVELPTASMKWLYHWAPVGTALTIKS
jgi:hypothetical protein